MIKEFKKLTNPEVALLMKAPALVSVLAASINNTMNNVDKADAIKLAHLKSFTSDPVLADYYKEVEINFKENFEQAENLFTPFDDAKRALLKNEIQTINLVICKLDREFAIPFQLSLSRYAEHVRKAEKSVLTDFIFPFILPGLTD